MKPIPRYLSVIATLFVSVIFPSCSRQPSAYDWFLKQNGGSHPDSISDPRQAIAVAARWAVDWRSSLAFFTAELDSKDPKHIKAGVLCLALLNFVIEREEPDQFSAESKSQFDKAFPIAKLKALIAEHPEYDEWISLIRLSKYASDFPEVRAQNTKKAETETRRLLGIEIRHHCRDPG